MNLFDLQREKILKKEAPLAARMRPESLEEFLGQTHIVGSNMLLYRAIKADKLTSIILYGPPGTGKTTLAGIIANTTRSGFIQLNATAAGIKDIKATIETARDQLAMTGSRTILFIDEIHRFNKSQQDAMLPHVEDGTIILIGATTENPYFEVNKALVSRSVIFELEPLSQTDIIVLLNRAVKDSEKGLGAMPIVAMDDALEFFADKANGDARTALNAIELAALTTTPAEDGTITIDLDVASACIQKRVLCYEKDGDNHYDTISAFIKSMRGSNPDAAVFYLAKMLYAGEDPKFIARRIVICAAEDVGNADPHALMVATAAAQAIDFIGMPEGRIILSQAVLYISCAPKSNSALSAITKAWQDVEQVQVKTVPPHLKDAHYSSASALKRGVDYKYAHDYPGNYVSQQYLPDELVGKIYYEPSDNGVERKIKDSLIKLRGET
ncbi:MAG: replication-associated recombination protein A [Defluviitaleaceae bacterium]|nr:replication-associated recombination protein A [Defluviitaleaceae bacterium]